MNVAISIKHRSAETGEWMEYTCAAVSGKTLGAFFAEAVNQEIVAEVVVNGVRCFFCGTEHWRERMERKGKAVLFDRAIEILREKNPGLLDEVIPGADLAAEIFEGSTVVGMTFENEKQTGGHHALHQ